MKKTVLLIAFTIFIVTNSFARARIPVCFPCEKIEEVKDLPNDESLSQAGEYLNLGYLYKEYGAVFVPFWNTTGQYILTNESKTTYYELSDEQLEKYKTLYNLELKGNPLSFWKKIGGKLILFVLIALILYGKFGKDPEEEETDNTNLQS